jgi:hypothetical protein
MKNCFIAEPMGLSQPEDFDEIDYKEINFSSDDFLDDWLMTFVEELNQGYTNIFIPLSFGQSLSDFLGLRLALYIRCADSPSRFSNLFLYGSETYCQILSNEFFDVLKLKGVHLIDYSIESIKKFENTKVKDCTENSITDDLNLLNLKVPMHLYDNHSVANVWGMHRLLDIAGVDSSDVKSLTSKRNNLKSIYFKWLLAKNNINDIRDKGVEEAEEKHNSYKLEAPKVIRKIVLPESNKKRFR